MTFISGTGFGYYFFLLGEEMLLVQSLWIYCWNSTGLSERREAGMTSQAALNFNISRPVRVFNVSVFVFESPDSCNIGNKFIQCGNETFEWPNIFFLVENNQLQPAKK